VAAGAEGDGIESRKRGDKLPGTRASETGTGSSNTTPGLQIDLALVHKTSETTCHLASSTLA
jgi:hypothetical protein